MSKKTKALKAALMSAMDLIDDAGDGLMQHLTFARVYATREELKAVIDMLDDQAPTPAKLCAKCGGRGVVLGMSGLGPSSMPCPRCGKPGQEG